jgi:hypothetical protein
MGGYGGKARKQLAVPHQPFSHVLAPRHLAMYEKLWRLILSLGVEFGYEVRLLVTPKLNTYGN